MFRLLCGRCVMVTGVCFNFQVWVIVLRLVRAGVGSFQVSLIVFKRVGAGA